MSGGYWEHIQYRFEDIASDIEYLIDNNNDTNVDRWGSTAGRFYNENTLQKFREAVHAIRRAGAMIQRIDYLLEGDDTEDSFHTRWDKHLAQVDALAVLQDQDTPDG